MGKARAKMKLAANVTEEQDWYLDTPDVRLTRIFTVVLLLHAIAIGGIIAFKMVDKASENTSITISSARQTYEEAVQEQKDLAAAVPASPASAEAPARKLPAQPLRYDPNNKNQYKVQAGDTLPEIAAELGVSLDAIRSVNSINSDNEVYTGRVLQIPSAQQAESIAVAKPAPAETTAPQPKKSNPTTYAVEKGDTMWGIARKFNVSYNNLVQVNGGINPSALQIGQKLKIPASN